MINGAVVIGTQIKVCSLHDFILFEAPDIIRQCTARLLYVVVGTGNSVRASLGKKRWGEYSAVRKQPVFYTVQQVHAFAAGTMFEDRSLHDLGIEGMAC